MGMAGTARGRFRRVTCPHGELEAHGGSGEEYGSCVRENDGCRDSRAVVCKEGAGGGPRLRERPYRVESSGGCRRACVLTECSQRAVEGWGERAWGLGNQEGHRVCPAPGVFLPVGLSYFEAKDMELQ